MYLRIFTILSISFICLCYKAIHPIFIHHIKIAVMRNSQIIILLLPVISFHLNLIFCQPTLDHNEVPAENSFSVYSETRMASVYYDTNDFRTVGIAADLLAGDIKMVTGHRPDLISDYASLTDYVIIIGSVQKCSLIQDLVKSDKIHADSLDGQWESYLIKTVSKPWPGINQALIIAGSDRRGTAYGVFEVSKTIGVSPWYWWADVTPEKRTNLMIESIDYLSEAPSVKYRGIFLNDEDWGLQPWAAKTYERETGDIGPNTYAKIFELLLRLKGNLIWPAMHNCTRAFYHYPENRVVADNYGIIVGSSHAEPMLRDNVDEWNVRTMGDFNYVTNRQQVYNYWLQRAEESKNYENIYTVGMRGIHDSGMEGVSSMGDKITILEKIITDQREILEKAVKRDVTKVPQAFIPYKEVLEIYDNGLKLPADITIVWPDDNYGYIRRLSDINEQSRSGGGGIYYHLSYWGRPHDYLWLSTTHPLLIWEELQKAYQSKCDRIWVFNVGDIKPAEYNIQLAMDMAWNMKAFSEPQNTWEHMSNWLGKIFGHTRGDKMAAIMREYYSLAFERKPEFMGWNQTEPTRVTNFSRYNHFYYNDEAKRRLNRYNSISEMSGSLKMSVPENRRDAFFELVYYPVICSALMNKKFLYHEKACIYASQFRSSSNDYALMSRQAYDSIYLLTDYYNHKLINGKWKYMMSMNPRNLPVFDCPMTPQWEVPDTSDWGICIEGYEDERPLENMYGSRLPDFNPGGTTGYFIDVFLTGTKDVKWLATSSEPWIRLSQTSGILKNEFLEKEKRIWVGIDTFQAPRNKILSGNITFKGENREFTVPVLALNQEINDFSGFIECDGYISLDAENFTKKIEPGGYKWLILNGLGYSGKSLMISCNNIQWNNKTRILNDKPAVEFDFYTFSAGDAHVNVYCLPSHPLDTSFRMRIALSVDDAKEQVFDYCTFGRSETWKQNVLGNMTAVHAKYKIPVSGKHTLKITALDPGVVIDRIIIDLGDLKRGYSAIPETKLFH